MPIPKEFLAILRLPGVQETRTPATDNSGYKCEACKRFYPVRDGIP